MAQPAPAPETTETVAAPATTAPTTDAGDTGAETASETPTYDGPAKGALRKLADGHFNDVAAMRLRLNHMEHLEAAGIDPNDYPTETTHANSVGFQKALDAYEAALAAAAAPEDDVVTDPIDGDATEPVDGDGIVITIDDPTTGVEVLPPADEPTVVESVVDEAAPSEPTLIEELLEVTADAEDPVSA